MELKTGYKQTEVGVIPNDWDVKELGEVAFLKRGKFTPRPRNNPIFYGGDIPFVQTGDVTNSNGKIMEYTQTLNEDGLAVSTLFKKGTILMTIAANIGYTGILQIDMACPDSLVAIDGLEKIDNVFLNYYFSFKRQELDNLSTSGTQKNLNIELLKPFKILLPPTLAEQTAIATALSDTDQYITHLEKLIAKKRNIKQGAMQELLKPKEGWVVKKLGECLTKNPEYGINAASTAYSDNLPTYLRITDISENGTFISENKVSVDHPLSNNYFLEKGDLVFARTGASVGKTYLYDENDGRLVFAGFLIRIRPNPEILNPILFKNLTETKDYWDWVKLMSMRSGQPGINGNEFKQFSFYLPSTKSEQTRIASILSDMDAEISTLETKLFKAQSIKQGMMQQLLTGKTRLI